MPVLYIITWSNGEGKSFVGSDYIPSHLRNLIFDGDDFLCNKEVNFELIINRLIRRLVDA